MLMPSIGVREPAISRATRSIVPSPPKTSSRSTSRASAAASGQTVAPLSSQTRRWRRRKTPCGRPARMSWAAWPTQLAQATLFGVADQPDAFDFVSRIFSINTRNSLLPAGPSSGDSVTPHQRRPGCAATNSCNSRSTRSWIAGSVMTPAPLVRLGFAGLKLRFDQRDDSTGRAQQCNGGWQNFAQRDERAINHDQVRRREGLREIRRRKMPGVGFFHHHHARVLAQLPGELALANIHGVDFLAAPPAAGSP